MHARRCFLRVSLSIAFAVLGAGLVLMVAQNRGQALAAGPQNTIPVTTTIQAAIDLASDGDVIDIPAGIYHESLSIYKTLTLRGVSSSTTIIEPPTGQRAITVDTWGDLFLQDLTLRNGQPVNNMGGGVYLKNGNLTMEKCQIVNNSASTGGGIFHNAASGQVRISNSLISGNSAGLHGGGLYVNGSLWITGTVISNNTAAMNGGGLAVSSMPLKLTSTTFEANHSGNWGGGIFVNTGQAVLNNVSLVSNAAANSGGGLLTQGPLVLVNSRVVQNATQTAHGGGIYALGGPLEIVDTEILTNTAGLLGGGVYFFDNALKLSGSQVRGNTAWTGGGLYIDWHVSAELSRNQILNNQAGLEGGGIYIANKSALSSSNNILAGNLALARGMAIMIKDYTQVLLNHDTLIGSPGPQPGAGIYLAGETIISATNTILSNYTLGLEVDAGGLADLNGVLLHGISQESTGEGVVNWGAQILREDPLFRDPVHQDYHLQPLSPARDAGLVSNLIIDIDGEDRPAGTGPDIGADEIHYFPISGLQAASDAPTTLGSPTSFTASVTSGTEAVYTWDFGDASPTRQGNAVQHLYTAAGKYTVRVLASNQLNQQALELEVEIRPSPTPTPSPTPLPDPRYPLFLPMALGSEH